MLRLIISFLILIAFGAVIYLIGRPGEVIGYAVIAPAFLLILIILKRFGIIA